MAQENEATKAAKPTGWTAATTPKELKAACRTCHFCRTSELKAGRKLAQCSLCKSAHYCGKECQTKHWPTHKEACKDHRRLFHVEEDAALFSKIRKWTESIYPFLAATIFDSSDLFPVKDGCFHSEKILSMHLYPLSQSDLLHPQVTGEFAVSCLIRNLSDLGASNEQKLIKMAETRRQEAAAAGREAVPIGFYTVACPNSRGLHVRTVGGTPLRDEKQGTAGVRGEFGQAQFEYWTDMLCKASWYGIAPYAREVGLANIDPWASAKK